ncbi:MAG TPA: hypothetical protein VFF87_01670 [Hyphomicrobium sp.]|nr:hypothetical protein [Hyphomicrobium sp.]
MTRTLAATLALAAASIAGTMLTAAPAQACISCAYVPETARSAATAPGEARSYSKSRSFRAAEERRARHSGNRKAKGETASRKVETAKTAPAEKPSQSAASMNVPAAETEHSSFAAASSRIETAAVPAAAEPGAATEHSTIATAEPRDTVHGATTTAAVAADAAKSEAPSAAGSNVGCKKFFPSAGMTLSVTCE